MVLFLRSKNSFRYIPENESEQEILGWNTSGVAINFPVVLAFCNVFPLYGCLLLIFHLLRSGTLYLPPPSPPTAPPLCHFRLVVASPSLSSVFDSISLNVALIFLCWTLLPTSRYSYVELYHRWLPQSILFCYVAFAALPYPACLDSVLYLFLWSSYSFLNFSFAFSHV